MGIDDAVNEAAGAALETASSHGGDTFLATLIVVIAAVLLAGFAAATFKFLLFPMRDAYIVRQQEQQAQHIRQTQVLAALSEGHRELGPVVHAMADGLEEIQQSLSDFSVKYANPRQFENTTAERQLQHIQQLLDLFIEALVAYQAKNQQVIDQKLTELRFLSSKWSGS